MLIPLITQERAQKLDLLVHLIRNLRQSLVIFGPKGIGKTTFLKALQGSKSESGAVLLLQATERLSFEQVQEQLFKELLQHVSGGQVESLAQLLQIYNKHNQYVVLLIDDAGQMVPGLIATLVQYAIRFNNLRIVFALTQEDLGLKHKTDAEIEDCHFLEIPPLSLSQCGEYAQYLHSTAAAPMTNNSLNEVMLERIYKKTAGVPGKIVEILPGLSASRDSGSGWLYALVAAGLVSVVVGLLLWRNITNVVTTDALIPSASSVIAPLEIPGQTKPELLAAAANPTATGGSTVNQVQRAPRTEIINSKPDYYSGFARVRDADALDEFKDKNERNKAVGESVEQLKVEIITPEPPPKEVVIASADSQIVRDNIPEKSQTKLSLPVNGSEERLSKSITEQNQGVQLVQKVAGNDAKLVHKEKNPELKAELATTKVNKKAIKSESKAMPKEIVHAREDNKPISGDVAATLKSAAYQEKIADNIKIKTENVKLTEVSQSKLVQETKQNIEEKKPVKVDPIDDASKKVMLKPEVEPAVNPEITESVKEVEKPKEDTKTQQPVVEAPNAEAPSVAKLGVLMKYKSDEVKAETSAKLEKKEQSANADTKPTKPSNAKYTLQLMTFSQSQSLQNFMGKYGSMGGNLRHFTVNKDGVERYVVVFGTYESAAQANAAKQKLPPEFQQALARKM